MKNLLSAALALLLMTVAAYAGGDDAHGNAKVSLFATNSTVGDKAVAADSNGYIYLDLKAIGGNALTTALPVTGTFFQTTQPVSGTFWQATQPVSGTFWQATQPTSAAASAFADGSIATLGLKADAKSAATDTTAITMMQVMKEISALEQTPASRAVTNAGTFAVQNTAATPAGTNTIGNVTEVPSATAGGLTPFTLTLAASTNATNIKASAGQLYSMSGFNMSSTTPVWVSLYDNASTPTCGTAVKAQFLIPGNATGSGYVFPLPDPIAFASGIAMCATTGITGTGNPGASTYVVNAFYK